MSGTIWVRASVTCRDGSRKLKLGLRRDTEQGCRQMLQEAHPKPFWTDHRPRRGTEWHLVSRRTPTPANQHTAWRSTLDLAAKTAFSLQKRNLSVFPLVGAVEGHYPHTPWQRKEMKVITVSFFDGTSRLPTHVECLPKTLCKSMSRAKKT